RRGVRLGLWCGRLERSTMPALPSCRYRRAHFPAVVTETPNRSAARRGIQPSSTTHRARRSLPVGVSGALAWDMKTSVVSVVASSLSHLTRRSSSCQPAMPTSDTTSVVSTASLASMRETSIPVPGTGGLQVTLHHADEPRAVLVLTHGFGEHSGRYGR